MRKDFLLNALIATALGATAPLAHAHPVASPFALDGISTMEPPRVTATVNDNQRFVLPKSHFGFLVQAISSRPMTGDTKLSHLQMVLRPSAVRHAAMESFIAAQHDPGSPTFHQWLSPTQFGMAFGTLDSDIAATVDWLKAQGFTVNSVYPNKSQIDFSGTVAQVNAAFRTTQTFYTFSQATHMANAADISIPTALKSVVAGVMGLNDFHSKTANTPPQIAQWNASAHRFDMRGAAVRSPVKVINQAVTFGASGTRALAPNDLVTMYGVRQLRNNGVVGKGVSIAIVTDGDQQATADDWENFISAFNLSQYGGSFSFVRPQPPSGDGNCYVPPSQYSGFNALEAAEWASAIAPGAQIVVGSCSDYSTFPNTATDNTYGGIFIAADNMINASSNRPDILNAYAEVGEFFTDSASKTAIDLMWAQADAEGISVYVPAGDSSVAAGFIGTVINGLRGNPTIDPNSFATSPHVTVVGSTDLADLMDGTTSHYFAPTPSAVGGSALSYVPEIASNSTCGNGVAAKELFGFNSPVAYCQKVLSFDPHASYASSRASGGGASTADSKPAWQQLVYDTAVDQSRDIPDVSLFGRSYNGYTYFMTCSLEYPCSAPYTGGDILLSDGTAISSAMFAGIQALMDQGLAARGLSVAQGNAAPTLYALAAQEYGAPGAPSATLSSCSADNGTNGTAGCVFHNVTRGSISTNCYVYFNDFTTPNCYYYGTIEGGTIGIGLTSKEASPTDYTASDKAYNTRPGWSFSAGLGSVNATNLLIAWRAFDHASSPATSH